MRKKINSFDKLYHGSDYQNKDEFEYIRLWGVKKFEGDQPEIMKDWVEKNSHPVDLSKLKLEFKWKDLDLMISDMVEKYTNYRMGEYKNYLKLNSFTHRQNSQ